MPAKTDLPFWKKKTLKDMTKSEWESLCDGCGKCCLNKIEYEDTGEVFNTRVVCELFDIKNCQCSNYAKRKKLVPDCTILTPKKVSQLDWLPNTCAYKLLDEGKELPEWHHLVSGSKATIHKKRKSLKGKNILNETKCVDLEDYIVDWK